METTQRSRPAAAAAERRRRELLEAADRVVLRDGPEASMNAIAAEAGITKPILYRHFGDKGGLYRALAKRHTDALLDALRAALDAPAERRGPGRGHARHLSRGDRGPPAGVPVPDAPGRGRAPPREQGFDVGPALGSAAAPAWARSWPRSSRSGVDLGPDSAAAGPGLGPRHRRHDARGRRLVAAVSGPAPATELVRSLADLLWGRLAAAGDRVGGPGF